MMGNESGNPGAWRIAERTAKFVLGGKANPVYSPVCIHEGLRTLRLGAAGASAAELDRLVETTSESQDRYGLLRDERHFSYDDYTAHIASGIWLDEKAQSHDSFLIACAREGIACTKTTLGEPDASEDIARWIADETEGLLKPSINLDPLALACVVSALYFKDAWETAFPKGRTKKDAFHSDEGTIEADFMASECELRVADFDFGTVVARPLSNGGSMVFVLPEENASLGDLLGNDGVYTEISAFDAIPTNVELHLPKFACELTVDDLQEALVRAGFRSAESPDLTPMVGPSRAPASYVHGAKISVDEDGLEAAAFFVMVAPAGLPFDEMEPPAPRIVKLDRPFLYAVVSKTREPLFVGTVTKPESDRFAWVPFPSDEVTGSEGGLIVIDEEIPGICRITLEDECPVGPYGITCGIYGWLVHTTWAHDYEEAMAKLKGMKKDLRDYAMTCDEDGFDDSKWAAEFTGKW